MTVDERKFIEVFVLPNDGERNVPLLPTDYDYVFSNLDEELFVKWRHFLSNKIEEYDDFDEYDKWYDELKFEDISEKDLIKFRLPTEQISMLLPPQISLFNHICQIVRDFYDELSTYADGHSNYYFGYQFETSPAYINMYVASIGDTDENVKFTTEKKNKDTGEMESVDVDLYSRMKSDHAKYENKIKKIMNNFNKIYGHYGISVRSNGISRNSFVRKPAKNDKGADKKDRLAEANENLETFKEAQINNFRYMDISAENFYHTAKSPVEVTSDYINKYVKKIFSCIEVEQKNNKKDLSKLNLIW